YHRPRVLIHHQCIEHLGRTYNLRILFLMCNISEDQSPIQELMGACSPPYKQPEHRPPTLICERVFKTPGTFRRTAFTNIPDLNRTELETLRTSFPGFSKIARANSVLLPHLPGFGLKMAARPKNTFSQPFRTAPLPASPLLPGAGGMSRRWRECFWTSYSTTTPPFLILRWRTAMRHPSSRARRGSSHRGSPSSTKVPWRCPLNPGLGSRPTIRTKTLRLRRTRRGRFGSFSTHWSQVLP
ncbi:hypothetical protein EDB85DRAFT_1864219, partial [Lactarius pseudohatsudake]